jgi:hypothetical protein
MWWPPAICSLLSTFPIYHRLDHGDCLHAGEGFLGRINSRELTRDFGNAEFLVTQKAAVPCISKFTKTAWQRKAIARCNIGAEWRCILETCNQKVVTSGEGVSALRAA